MDTQNHSNYDEPNEFRYPQVAVIIVPYPAQGHLNQLLHLSHLLTSYDISVHYAGSASHNHQAKIRLHGWDPIRSSRIHFHDFQLPPFNTPPPSLTVNFPAHLQPLFEATVHLRQPVTQLLQQLSSMFKRVVVIHDSLMASVVQDVKSILNAESYAFVPVSAFNSFFRIWESSAEKPFQLDSDIPCVPSIEGCLTPEAVHFVASQQKFLDLASGKIYNTSRVVEGKYVKLLEKLPKNSELKHFAFGPFNPVQIVENKNGKKRHKCLEWLDKQEKDSVIYVSFGSITSMTEEQIRELAIGLENSRHKFVWVLRKADQSDVFAEDGDIRSQLPEGYEERVEHRGIVVTDWAPQLQILAHPSTGGFMSHCGWNSCIESISMGVPIAAWPMHSDQPNNTVLVTQVLKIGLVVRDWAYRTQLVPSATVESAVITLMLSQEGEEMRNRATKLGQAVQDSVAKGGTSRLEMESFIDHISRC